MKTPFEQLDKQDRYDIEDMLATIGPDEAVELLLHRLNAEQLKGILADIAEARDEAEFAG